MTPAQKLQSAFLALLPQGRAWHFEGSRWTDYAAAATAELARLRTDALTLLRTEADPRTAAALLGAWEKALGLPDPLHPPALSISARRAAVLARLTSQSAPTKKAVEDLIKLFGGAFTWDAAPAAPFEVGLSGAGDPVGGITWIYVRRATVTGIANLGPLQAALDALAHSYTRVVVHK